MYKEYLDTVSVFETNGEVKPFGWSKEPIFFYNKINLLLIRGWIENILF